MIRVFLKASTLAVASLLLTHCAAAPVPRVTQPWSGERALRDPADGRVAAAEPAGVAPMPPATAAAPEATPPPTVAAPAPVARPAGAAASSDARVRFAGTLVLEHQLNAIATIVYTDGHRTGVGDALVGLTGGAAIPLTRDGRFELQGVGGFLLSKANASNGSVTFWTFPIEVTAHARLGRFRLGAGPTVHVAPMLRTDGFAATLVNSMDFDTQVGALGQVEFLLSPSFALALRGTWLTLASGNASMDASRIGGAVTFYL